MTDIIAQEWLKFAQECVPEGGMAQQFEEITKMFSEMTEAEKADDSIQNISAAIGKKPHAPIDAAELAKLIDELGAGSSFLDRNKRALDARRDALSESRS